MKRALACVLAVVVGAGMVSGCCCRAGGRPSGPGGPQSSNWHAYMSSYRKPVQYRVISTLGTPGTAPYAYGLLCSFEKPEAQAEVWIMVDSAAGESRKASRGAVRLVSVARGTDPLDELLRYGPGGDFELEEETVYVATEGGGSEATGDSAIVPRPWPVLITRYVGVGAEASRFILQTNVGGDPDRERVICCHPRGGPIVVGIALESEPHYESPVERINAGEYVEFKKGEKLSRGTWAEGDEIGQVVKGVLERAEGLGVP